MPAWFKSLLESVLIALYCCAFLALVIILLIVAGAICTAYPVGGTAAIAFGSFVLLIHILKKL